MHYPFIFPESSEDLALLPSIGFGGAESRGPLYG